MIGIVVAQEEEARDLIEVLNLHHNWQNLHYGDNIILSISGVGMLNAAMATRFLLDEDDHMDKLINIGTCGGRSIQPNTIVSPRIIHNADMDLTAFGHDLYYNPGMSNNIMITGYEGLLDVPCYTTSKFNDKIISKYEQYIIDMELYGIAFACKSYHPYINLSAIKLVTDNSADTNDAKYTYEENLANNYKDFVKKIASMIS